MTDLTPRDSACLRARKAHEAMLRDIEDLVPSAAARDLMREHLEELYSACALICRIGDGSVYPAVQTQVGKDGDEP